VTVLFSSETLFSIKIFFLNQNLLSQSKSSFSIKIFFLNQNLLQALLDRYNDESPTDSVGFNHISKEEEVFLSHIHTNRIKLRERFTARSL
jgi:hypothetical protein